MTQKFNGFSVRQWKVSRFPVIANAGVYYLQDLARHGTNAELEPGTAYVFFNRAETIAIGLTVGKSGMEFIPWRMRPANYGETFNVSKYRKGRSRNAFVDITPADAYALLQMRNPQKTAKE